MAPAAQSARTARALVAKATAREQSHVDALEAWVAGDLDRTLAIWEAILADHPTDVLALRLAHLKYFWLGRPRDMLASVERVVPQWDRDLPGWGAILSCCCFAHEECGNYVIAEAAGRAAVELDAADLWATHAVAHVAPFTLPHWLMALAATGRYDAAQRMLEAMRAFSRGGETIAAIVGDVALPVGEAVLAHRRGQYSRVVELMRPVLADMHRLGGSHAQQDVLNQLFLDAAVKAGRADDVRLILAHVADQHGAPQTQRVGYADAARRVLSSGNGG